MSREKLIIGGYRVPGGWGGVMVRRACEIVSERPGISQKDLLEESCRYAGLNLSTAGWLTTPGPKSPSGILWDRRTPDGKKLGFMCFPNDLTSQCLDASRTAQALWISDTLKLLDIRTGIKPGTLCRLISRLQPETMATFLGWAHNKSSDDVSGKIDSLGFFETFDAALDASRAFVPGSWIEPVFVKPDPGGIWNSRNFFISKGGYFLEIIAEV